MSVRPSEERSSGGGMQWIQQRQRQDTGTDIGGEETDRRKTKTTNDTERDTTKDGCVPRERGSGNEAA